MANHVRKKVLVIWTYDGRSLPMCQWGGTQGRRRNTIPPVEIASSLPLIMSRFMRISKWNQQSCQHLLLPQSCLALSVFPCKSWGVALIRLERPDLACTSYVAAKFCILLSFQQVWRGFMFILKSKKNKTQQARSDPQLSIELKCRDSFNFRQVRAIILSNYHHRTSSTCRYSACWKGYQRSLQMTRVFQPCSGTDFMLFLFLVFVMRFLWM